MKFVLSISDQSKFDSIKTALKQLDIELEEGSRIVLSDIETHIQNNCSSLFPVDVLTVSFADNELLSAVEKILMELDSDTNGIMLRLQKLTEYVGEYEIVNMIE